MIFPATLLLAFALSPQSSRCDCTASDGKAVESMTVRVLVAPTGCHLPFYVERNGTVVECIDICEDRALRAHFGDIVSCALPYGGKGIKPIVSSMSVVGHDDSFSLLPVTADEFYSITQRLQFVAVKGTVFDVCKDDIDANYAFAFLDVGGKTITAAFGINDGAFPGMRAIVGNEVLMTGVTGTADAILTPRGGRRFPRRTIRIGGADNCRILRPVVHGEKRATVHIDDIGTTPEMITATPQLRISGSALVSWPRNHVLVACSNGAVCRAELATEKLPETGAAIELVGRPETDLFDVNLVRASWKPSGKTAVPEQQPHETAIRNLFENYRGEAMIDSSQRGKVLSVCGTIKSIAYNEVGNRSLLIKDGDYSLNIICGASVEPQESVAEGCRVRVTGVCVMDSDHWRPQVPLPAVRGLFLVVRKPSDIAILAYPPWWTPGRILATAFILMSLLICIVAWNIALHKRARRLGNEIAESELSRRLGKLKIAERTRLAVELHDGIVQNLTGVSMGIRSAMMSRKLAPDQLDGHLRLALLSLDSCRDELRDCIWDLHNLTLDESTANESIRKAVGQHLNGAKLAVRFNVPRRNLPDNVFYALIRIIRELVINAVRHGHATEIKIAGSAENGHLFFSVHDNGQGFDARHAPGMEQGHFGLQGIADRVESLNGTFDIDSTVGKGTKARVELSLETEAKADS